MRSYIFSSDILEKLGSKHNVDRCEVEQCFENHIGLFLIDTREDHRTEPPTLWFLALTNKNRLLKVVFIHSDGNFIIKSAFEPNEAEISIYEKHGR